MKKEKGNKRSHDEAVGMEIDTIASRKVIKGSTKIQ